MALIQGVTEFLPVSSSGHMFLYQYFTGQTSDFRLEIWFHLASVVALLLYFHKSIGGYLMAFLMDLFRPKSWKDNEAYLLLVWALVSCGGILAFVSFIPLPEILTLQTVALTLCVTAILIFLSAFWPQKKELLESLTWPLALLVGVIQVFAVLPGMSRSGLVLAVLILFGVERSKAFSLAMISGIPIIIGASLYGVKELSLGSVVTPQFLGAFVVCVLGSLAGIIFLRSLVRNHWSWFGVYCLMLGSFLFFMVGI